MNSYENEILELLQGKTPKEKYEYLLNLIDKIKYTKTQLESFKNNTPFLNVTQIAGINFLLKTLEL